MRSKYLASIPKLVLLHPTFYYCLTNIQDKDSNQNFVRIQKFAPKFEICRSNGSYWKRLTLHGSDNSKTSFAVQLPCHRHYRREDRVMQILRTFNGSGFVFLYIRCLLTIGTAPLAVKKRAASAIYPSIYLQPFLVVPMCVFSRRIPRI
jgi:hypothetical protein